MEKPDSIEWKRSIGKKYYLKFMLLSVSLVFMLLIVFGLLMYILDENIYDFYVGFVLFSLVFIAVIIAGLIGVKRMSIPKRVGFDDDKIYIINNEGEQKVINFRDIKKISCSSDERDALYIYEGGERVKLNGGFSGKFGMSLMGQYKDWINHNTDNDVSMKQEKHNHLFSKTRKYIIKKTQISSE